MKRIKRSFVFLLALVFCIVAFASCSGGTEPAGDGTTTSADTETSGYNWPELDGTVIYVDGSAAEEGDGSKDKPFKTVPEAQEKIRDMKSVEGLPAGGITVLVAPGEYNAVDGISFTADDSGTAESPITYRSAEQGGAVLNGGITLKYDDFEALSDEEKAILNDDTAKNTVIKVDLKKYGVTADILGQLHKYGFSASGVKDGYSELFIGGERMTIARYPNVSEEKSDLRIGNSDGTISFDILAEGDYEEKALAMKERGKNWDVDELWTLGYFQYTWSEAAVKVATFDPDTLSVSLEPGMLTFGGIYSNMPVYFYNIFAEIDEAGEYYIDRENAVLYVYPTENFATETISISAAKNNIINGSNVSYINFDGFVMTGSRSNGIIISGENITVENCKITDVRFSAVEINGSNIILSNNEMCQIGDGGIIATGGVPETLTSSGIVIDNNYIHHWGQVGRTYKAAVTLNGCGVTVTHNEMHDAPHQAVTWSGPNHLMEYNEVYNVCLETSDCGAFYSGRRFDWYGCVLRYNFIHDVGSGTAGAHGIYFDDVLSGQTAYGNIIMNVTGNGFAVGGGRDNVIENNLIINCGINGGIFHSISYDNRGRDGIINGEGDWFYEHIVGMSDKLIEMQGRQEWLDAFPGYGDIIPYEPGYTGDIDDPMLSGNPANNIIRMNIFFTPNMGMAKDINISYQVFKLGTLENNYNISDPNRVQMPGYDEGDLTLAEGCQIYELGFEKIPLDEIGRVTK